MVVVILVEVPISAGISGVPRVAPWAGRLVTSDVGLERVIHQYRPSVVDRFDIVQPVGLVVVRVVSGFVDELNVEEHRPRRQVRVVHALDDEGRHAERGGGAVHGFARLAVRAANLHVPCEGFELGISETRLGGLLELALALRLGIPATSEVDIER